MKKDKVSSSSADGLRKLAEEHLKQKKAPELLEKYEDTQRLFHELQVHQIELEIQNEELRDARDEVEAELAKYADLYDFAPVGYFTFDRNSTIIEVNLTGASLLGGERQRLVKRRFASFVAQESRPAFHAFLDQVFANGEKQTCESLIISGGQPLHVRIEAVKDSSGQECRVIVMDITERKLIEEKLNREEQRFRALVEHSSDIIVLMNLEGIITYINPAVENILGFKVEERIGANGFERVHPDDFKFLNDSFNTLIRDTNAPVIHGKIRLHHKNGSVLTLEAVGSNLVNNNVVEAVIINYRDITERIKAEEKMRTLTITDPLTELYNRRGFLSIAEQQLKLAERNKSRLVLLFADLDGLKWINNTLGHKEGDKALIEVACLLKETFRSSDIIGRMGGDEFAILTIDPEESHPKSIIKRLQHRIDKRNHETNAKYKLSISVGFSSYDAEHPVPIDKLMASADILMYE